mmetsp:Transcript_185/g.245  ORF Transcript_185/g.245 Transcript_185/m.245 type:complete len:224 (+) Transcript_185:393-1064(+)
MIARIRVAIEGLDTESSAQIPKGNGFVPRCCQDIVGEGLKGHEIHGVYMAAEGLTASHAGHVKGFDGLVHGTGHYKISKIVKRASPHWLSVVCECVLALLLGNIPDLDGGVAGRSSNQRPSWMKRDATDPIPVTFAAEDQLTFWHGPHLPCMVITCCSHHRNFGMEGHTRDGSHMSFEDLSPGKLSHSHGLEVGVRVWIRPVFTWPWSFSQCPFLPKKLITLR